MPAGPVQARFEQHVPAQVPVALRFIRELDLPLEHDRILQLRATHIRVQPVQAGSGIDAGAGPQGDDLVVRHLGVADGIRGLR